MTEYPIFVFMALLLLVYGLFSKRLERSMISAPMLFVGIGILAAGWVDPIFENGQGAAFTKPIAEFTLLLVLFVDASTIKLNELGKYKWLPIRMLGIGLPLTMIVGALLALLIFPGEGTVAMILMALILSPTDAALGQPVVKGEKVPLRIRQTLNMESGLNDGMALPPILICIAILSETTEVGQTASYWLIFTLKQFVFGPVVGAAIGWFGGWLVDWSSKKGWMNHAFQMLASVAIAVLAYASAEYFGGNGFIAAFCAGLLLGTHTHAIRVRIQEFGEAESQALELFIFLLFGMALVPVSYPFWDWQALLYSALSITVIRMVPVAISLLGLGLDRKSIAFLGWFGPRGIVSVLYALLVIEALGVDGYERLISVVTLTVLMSIVLHGLTAVPFARIFKAE